MTLSLCYVETLVEETDARRRIESRREINPGPPRLDYSDNDRACCSLWATADRSENSRYDRNQARRIDDRSRV
jgi:hypothetical protein